VWPRTHLGVASHPPWCDLTPILVWPRTHVGFSKSEVGFLKSDLGF